MAPYFAIGMVFFLMAFAAYFVFAVLGLVFDFAALDAACAEESWVWLFVLLAIVSCSVLQCAAVCCSVLQCVAVCCSVLQRVAACCSVACRALGYCKL